MNFWREYRYRHSKDIILINKQYKEGAEQVDFEFICSTPSNYFIERTEHARWNDKFVNYL